MNGISQILVDYDEKCELYEAFTQRLHALICELLEINLLNVVSVTNRVKERDKLEEKIMKKEDMYSCLEDITDVSGLRIITYFADDVDRVAEIIKSEFEIDWDNSVDKRDIMLSNQFGYMSLHYIISLTEPRASLSENIRFRDCKAELQIRSILQHAWAEIEHDLGYKAELDIPQKMRRRFTRIAGLLEVADSEFDTIRQRLVEYRAEVGRRIIEDPTEVYIDKDSLENYILFNQKYISINIEIARKSGHTYNPETPWAFINFTSRLAYFNIKTISELENALEDRREIIINYAVEWFSGRHQDILDSAFDMKEFGPSIPIHYLIYVLCGEYGRNEFTMSHLLDRFPANEEAFFDLVFDTYNQLKLAPKES